MNYLKDYKSFNEDFTIEDSDASDVKAAKEKLNDIKKQLSNYKSQKGSLDSLYNTDESVDNDKLKKIIGDENKNPFLLSYSSVCSLEKKIKDLKNKRNNKSIELSELKDKLNDADDSSKENIEDRIDKVEEQISNIDDDINEANKKLPDIKKQHEEKMKSVEDDMKKWISKIQ